ncbi:hypothetical protein KJ751_03715 [Patescibacteria group bacterium]|nr:hypothetical protein [Patescibacteria group bacterium]
MREEKEEKKEVHSLKSKRSIDLNTVTFSEVPRYGRFIRILHESVSNTEEYPMYIKVGNRTAVTLSGKSVGIDGNELVIIVV